jgi:hypothetical protein
MDEIEVPVSVLLVFLLVDWFSGAFAPDCPSFLRGTRRGRPEGIFSIFLAYRTEYRWVSYCAG